MSKLLISNLKLYAGAKWKWTESVSDYPATLYTLDVYLKYQAETTIKITATPSGSDHLLQKIASETTGLSEGDYKYQARFTEIADTSNVTLYEEGIVHIYPDLATVTDARTYWMQIVENLKDAYKRLSTREMKEVTTYDGTRVTYEERNTLLKEIKTAEINAGIKKANRKIKARFV